MNAETAAGAAIRLQNVLSASVVVDPEVFPRLVRALVQSAGPEGEVDFGLQLIREEDHRRAVELIELSPGVLGEKAIAYLRAGASRWKSHAARMLATASALGQLASPEAHQILCAIERESANPEVRKAVAGHRRTVEVRHPTRYVLLPALLSVSPRASEEDALAKRLLDAEDQELVPLLLDAWEGLAPTARVIVLRVLAVRGDSLAGHTLQSVLEEGGAEELVGPLCQCLRQIFARHPEAVKGYEALWRRLWTEHGGIDDVADAAAVALSAAPEAENIPLYSEFIRSSRVGVRIAGLRAFASVPTPEARSDVMTCLASGNEAETAAALEVLVALGDGRALREWAGNADPARRRGVARVCLRALGPAAWLDLASDPDPTVAEAALDAWDEAPPEARPNNRQVEPLLGRAAVPPVFQRACRILAAIGDVDTVGVVAGHLRSEPWKRIFVVRILKALRIRKVFHWRELPEGIGTEILRVLEEQDDLETLSLLSILVKDFSGDDLARLGALLHKRYDDCASDESRSPGLARVVLGKLLEAVSREQLAGEVERLIDEAREAPGHFPSAVSTAARVWLRFGDALGPERVARVERFLCEVAEDRSRRHQERSEALAALGARGSAEAMRMVSKLCAHPVEALAAAATASLASYGKRNPAGVIPRAEFRREYAEEFRARRAARAQEGRGGAP